MATYKKKTKTKTHNTTNQEHNQAAALLALSNIAALLYFSHSAPSSRACMGFALMLIGTLDLSTEGQHHE